MNLQQKSRIFREAYTDFAGLIAMIATSISVFFFIGRLIDQDFSGLILDSYIIFSKISKFTFDHLFYFINFRPSQPIKDVVFLYLLTGGICARSYRRFVKLGKRDVRKGYVDNFVYGYSESLLGKMLNPFGKFLFIRSIFSTAICFLSWPVVARIRFGYFGFRIPNDPDGDLDIVTEVDFRPIFGMQLLGVLAASVGALITNGAFGP